jgi:DNA-binding response OmpR family regulator
MAPQILIVEDDKKIAATIKLYLEHEGYRTSLATAVLPGAWFVAKRQTIDTSEREE